MSATEEKPAAPATEEEKMPELEPVTEKKPEEQKPEPHAHHHDHDHEHDHEHEDEHDDHKLSKAEKKARKAAKALGLRPIAGCQNMNVRGEKGSYFSVADPEVFRVGSTNYYIVFGQMKMEDPTVHAQEEAAKEFQPAAPMGQAPGQADISQIVSQIEKEAPKQQETPAEEHKPEEEGEVDITGLNPEEINIVMTQAGVTKKKAVEALRANDGDYIQAIISLTK